MTFSAKQLAEILNGTIEGNPDTCVSKLAKIEEGDSESLTFLANPAYTNFIYSSNASIAIVNKDFVPEQPVKLTLIRVENAYAAFVQLLELYNTLQEEKKGISADASIDETAVLGENVYVGPKAVIGKNAKIGNNVKIYPLCYIGDNCFIGDNSKIYPSVTIYKETKIGARCTIHSGVIIGGDGFGFTQSEPGGDHKKVIQIGNVIIEDDVEVGANTCIDRATLGSTIIRKGCKLDNLIMIAHNVEVGEKTLIVSQVGIAGSTKIGKNCVIGGQVGIVGHISIADNVKIQAQSGIPSSITQEGMIVQGAPAFNIKEYLRSYVHFKNLPSLVNKIQSLEKEIEELKKGK
jgi:UDP-3-O-[3-hydroxymyristoyl] glucosamine N-acyltransferase